VNAGQLLRDERRDTGTGHPRESGRTRQTWGRSRQNKNYSRCTYLVQVTNQTNLAVAVHHDDDLLRPRYLGMYCLQRVDACARTSTGHVLLCFALLLYNRARQTQGEKRERARHTRARIRSDGTEQCWVHRSVSPHLAYQGGLAAGHRM
jgi:hypothetical protein